MIFLFKVYYYIYILIIMNNVVFRENRNMNAPVFNAYNINDLIAVAEKEKSVSEEVLNFYREFNFETIIKDNLAKTNSLYTFKNLIKEDTTKSKITQALNKLHQQNMNKILASIREINFKNMDELNELVNQCINKIKKESEQIKPIIAALCFELSSTYFTSAEGEKIYFRKLLLTAVREDYRESLCYSNDTWSKEKSEKSMILIGTLYNSKIIDDKVMGSIFKDLKNIIMYKENQEKTYYDNVEKAIQNLSFLVSIINVQEENSNIYEGLDKFLEKELDNYEREKHCISKKVRIICKNIIDDIKKTFKN